jgi:site-specific DNA-methyltransferase (adenine-specific)
MVGDCREVMAGLADGSVDAIVTDPPYELGFMGKSWDASGIAYDLEVWRQALRVLKPGGHLLAFSGSRTYHRMVCAIEDAGFEVRDQIMWLYGSGFPKSHDVSKAIDREAGAERDVVGEKINCSSPFVGHHGDEGATKDVWRDERQGLHHIPITAPATPEAEQWSGWGTALKPAHEPIVVARKPFKGTVVANVLEHGTGALNVDGCRVGTEGGTRKEGDQKFGWDGSRSGARVMITKTDGGRWPANLIHDASDEVTSGLGEASRFFYCAKASKRDREEGLDGFESVRTGGMQGTADGSLLTGSGNERTTTRANIHPTVKPTDLMRYLCRLVTPPGGLVLDPFTGSGSTGKAAVLEGFRFLGCELSEEYAAIARARIAAASTEAP